MGKDSLPCLSTSVSDHILVQTAGRSEKGGWREKMGGGEEGKRGVRTWVMGRRKEETNHPLSVRFSPQTSLFLCFYSFSHPLLASRFQRS